MGLLNMIRYAAFALVEGIKSDSVLRRKRLIEKCMQDDNYYDQYKQKKIKDILEYASNNTLFYRKYKDKPLESFPVITKNDIVGNENAFESLEYKNKPVHIMSTSGSTGRRFQIKQDYGKRKQVLADIIYFASTLGYYPGKKLIYLRNMEAKEKKSKFKQFLQNENLLFIRKLDDETLYSIYQEIANAGKDIFVLGYASTLHIISRYMEEHNLYFDNVSAVINGAEVLSGGTRSLIEKQFKCKCVSRYSNQEMGPMAQDDEVDHFNINRASYIVEVLCMDKDVPAEKGEMGRIVVTDLYNKATPLIRYDTGDLGTYQETKTGKPYIYRISGRMIDIFYTTKDEPFSGFAFDDYFEYNDAIDQYQVIQEDKYNITLNIILKKGRQINEQESSDAVKDIVGQDCKVKINYLDQTPITESGKFRLVIGKYKPNPNERDKI